MTDQNYSLIADIIKETSNEVILYYPGVGKFTLYITESWVVSDGGTDLVVYGYNLIVRKGITEYVIENTLPAPMLIDPIRIDMTVDLLYRQIIEYYYSVIRSVKNNSDYHRGSYVRN